MNRLNLALMRVTAAALEQVRPLPHFCKGVHDTSTRESFYFKSPNSWLSCHRFGATWQDTEFFVPFFTPGQYTLQMRYYPAQAPDFVCADPVLLLLVLLVLLLLLLLLMATADFTSDVVVRRPEPGQMRIGAHADSNGFTIVRLDGRPGLEVRIADSEGTRHWVPVSRHDTTVCILLKIMISSYQRYRLLTGLPAGRFPGRARRQHWQDD